MRYAPPTSVRAYTTPARAGLNTTPETNPPPRMTTFFQTYGVPAADVGGSVGAGTEGGSAVAAGGGGSGSGGEPHARVPTSNRASSFDGDVPILMLARLVPRRPRQPSRSAMRSATRRPSSAALTMPPACPAPSPAG